MKSCFSCSKSKSPKKSPRKSPKKSSSKQKNKLSCTKLQNKVRNFNLNKSNYSLNNFNFSVCMTLEEKKQMMKALRLYQQKVMNQAKTKLTAKQYEKVERQKFILNTLSPTRAKSIENELQRLKKEINSPIRSNSIKLKSVKRSP